MTGLDLVNGTFDELGIRNAVDPLGAEDAALGLALVNRVLDNFNAERAFVYAEALVSGTLTPALVKHTIGPTGTFIVTQRPVSIEGCHLSISGIRYDVDVHPYGWYTQLASPAITSAIPTDVAFNPTWSNGDLYFYPVPTAAQTVELLVRIVLAAMTLVQTFDLPPGYQDAIQKTAAENLVGPMRVSMPPALPEQARLARARIQSNNLEIPSLETCDAGLPGGKPSWFDYRSGQTQ